MSELKIDKLFREKVGDNQVKPSNEAWEKLSTKLKKDKGGKELWYWYVAASLVLLAGASVIWMNISPNRAPVVADSAPAQMQSNDTPEEILPKEEALLPQHLAMTESRKIEEKRETEKATVKAEKESVVPEQSEDGSTQPEEQLAQIQTENVERSVPLAEELGEEEAPLLAISDETTVPTLSEPEDYPEIRIVYKASKKTEPDRNTLQKVVELARDIRQADIGLGTLRDAKNELLAFSLKKEKEPLEK